MIYSFDIKRACVILRFMQLKLLYNKQIYSLYFYFSSQF